MAVAPTIDLPSQWVLWWKVPIELARSRVRLLSLWHPSHHFLHGDRSLPLWPGWAPRWGRAQWRRRRHRTRASCQTRWKARGSHRSQREDPLENPNRVILVNFVTYKRSESSANTIHSLHPWKNGTLPDDVKRKWATNMVQSRVPAYPPSLPCKREDCRVHGGLSHRSQTPRGWVDHLKQLQIDQWVVVYLIKSDAMKNEFPDLIRGRNPKATLVTPDKALVVLIASFVW